VLYHTERNSDVYVASLDQKAAFDSVRFTSLFLKLGRLGFTGPFLRLLVATYKELKAIVFVSGLVLTNYWRKAQCKARWSLVDVFVFSLHK